MKKSISIVIALVLLLNVFAVSAFAAVPDGNAIAITLAADKDSYVAGDTVNVTMSIETIAGVPAISAGEIEVSYNSAIFAPAADISNQPSLEAYGCTIGEILKGNFDTGANYVRESSGTFNASDEAAYGWNAGLHIAACENFENVTHVDCSTGPKTFVTFPIKINAGVADGTYTIGVNKATFEDSGEAYLFVPGTQIYGGEGSQFGVADDATFACGTLDIVVGTGEGGSGDGGDTPDPTPTVTVSNSDTRVKWSDKANGKIYIGFEGVLTGFTPVTEVKDGRTEVTNIGSVGFRFSTTDATLASGSDVAARTLYDFNDGTYKFRAIVETDYNSESNLYATAYIKLEANGNATLTSDTIISTSVAAEYAEATGKGLPAFGA